MTMKENKVIIIYNNGDIHLLPLFFYCNRSTLMQFIELVIYIPNYQQYKHHY